MSLHTHQSQSRRLSTRSSRPEDLVCSATGIPTPRQAPTQQMIEKCIQSPERRCSPKRLSKLADRVRSTVRNGNFYLEQAQTESLDSIRHQSGALPFALAAGAGDDSEFQSSCIVPDSDLSSALDEPISIGPAEDESAKQGASFRKVIMVSSFNRQWNLEGAGCRHRSTDSEEMLEFEQLEQIEVEQEPSSA